MFILYDAILGGLIKGVFGTLSNYIVHYIYNISLFYINALIVLPFAFKKGTKLFLFIPFLLIIELSLYILIVYVLDSILIYHIPILYQNELYFDKEFVLGFTWRGCYFMLFSTGYFFFERYVKERDEKESTLKKHNKMLLDREIIEKKLLEVKNQFLLAQINPHFIFNTLNFIYYITLQNHNKGAQAILLLSKIMRYSSDIEHAAQTITLSKEIEYVKTLIELHQLRFKENVYLEFYYHPKTESLNIIPLVLITIAENMFKHGHINNPDYPSKLHVLIDDENNLIITCINKCRHLIENKGFKSGLSNLKVRLRLAYEDNAKITFSTRKDMFNLKLMIKIK